MSQDNLSDLALQMYYKTGSARRIEAADAGRKSRSATWPLLVFAVFQGLGFLSSLGLMQLIISSGRAPEKVIHAFWLFTAICGAQTALAWGLWIWSRVNPLPPAILGLILCSTGLYAIVSPLAGILPGLVLLIGSIIPLIGIAFLTKAIIYASNERRTMLALSNPEEAAHPQPRKIASAIWLYLILLSIVTIPLGLMADHNYAFHDFIDVMKLEAIVVATWAIIAWRDTLPAYRNLASPSWYGMAILIGIATSLFASLSSDLLSAFTGGKPPLYSPLFLEHGIGWLGIVGFVALYPAIFEEMAFRGVILQCFRRLLTDNEAIIVSGTMFMILHLSPVSFVHLLALGLILGYVRVKSGSIYPCMLIHFTHNAMVVAFEYWKF